jgi:hypothetical protein
MRWKMYVLSVEGISTFLLLHNILTWSKNTEKGMLKAIDKKISFKRRPA